jgi:hypothetical protein
MPGIDGGTIKAIHRHSGGCGGPIPLWFLESRVRNERRMLGSGRGYGRPGVERPYGARSLLYSIRIGRHFLRISLITVSAKEENVSDFNWTCPHCERAVTISGERYSSDAHTLQIANAIGRHTLVSLFIVCPNPECRQYTLTVALHESQSQPQTPRDRLLKKLQDWPLIPPSHSKHFPDYVPQTIREDYGEACLIRDLIPKASATLSRRCLQGILRDFWKVKPGRLVDEIEEVKDRIDPITWDAIEAVRKLGNIGAHMEKDINVIVDVDPEEAGLLIGLVETLLKECYVAREERKVRMAAVIAAAASKKTP